MNFFNLDEILAFPLKKAKNYKESKTPKVGFLWKENKKCKNYAYFKGSNEPFALKPPKDIIVLDFDSEVAMKSIIKYIKKIEIKTFMYKTNNGMHMWFKHSSWSKELVSSKILKNCSKHITGCGIECDVRLGGDGYVAIRVSDNGKITDRTEGFTNTDTIAEIPPELIPLFNNAKGEYTPPCELVEGGRNDGLIRFYGGVKSLWISNNLPKEKLYDYMKRCMYILNHVIYEKPSDDLMTTKLKSFGRITTEDLNRAFTKNQEYQQAHPDRIKVYYNNNNFMITQYKTITDKEGNESSGGPSQGILKLGNQRIVMRYQSGTNQWKIHQIDEAVKSVIKYTNLQMYDGITMWIFEGEKFRVKPDNRTLNLEILIAHIFKGLNVLTSTIKDFVVRILFTLPQNSWRSERTIQFANCKYDWYYQKIKENGNKKSPYTINHNYNPNAKVPELWTQILENVSGGDKDIITQIKEVFALAMLDSIEIKKFVMVYGPTHTGKTLVFNDIMSVIIGEDNIANEPLDFLTSKNAGSTLIGKLLNFVDDENSQVNVQKLDKLRSITSGATIQIEAKYMNPISTKLCASLVFGVNKLPELRDSSGAMDNRLHIIPFLQSFKNVPSHEQLKMKRSIKEMMKNEEAIEGIIKDVIDTLNILSSNSFVLTESDLSKNIKKEQESQNQIELGWLREDFVDYIEPHVISYRSISTNELFSAFRMWCTKKSIKVGTQHSFNNNLVKALEDFSEEVPYQINKLNNPRMILEHSWTFDNESRSWIRSNIKMNGQPTRCRGYEFICLDLDSRIAEGKKLEKEEVIEQTKIAEEVPISAEAKELLDIVGAKHD